MTFPSLSKTSIYFLTVLTFVSPYQIYGQSPENEYQDAADEVVENIESAVDEVFSESAEQARKFDSLELDNITLSKTPMYQGLTDHRPKVGELVQVYMGDRMIVQRYGHLADCLIPRISWEDVTSAGHRAFVKANSPICKNEPKDKKYTPTYLNAFNAEGQGVIYPLVLKKNKNGSMKLCIKAIFMSVACKDELSESELSIGAAFVSHEGSLQRTIEYMGKSGPQLKFLYSEYQDGIARDSFNREFEIDLNEDPVIAFKGAVLEVVSATNATISYRVVRHFEN